MVWFLVRGGARRELLVGEVRKMVWFGRCVGEREYVGSEALSTTCFARRPRRAGEQVSRISSDTLDCGNVAQTSTLGRTRRLARPPASGTMGSDLRAKRIKRIDCASVSGCGRERLCASA